jgi:hypothetical protein
MTEDIDRILTDDPAPPASPYFAAHVMRAVRTAAEPPPRVSVWSQWSSPGLAGGIAVVGLALAVYVDTSLMNPAAAALIALTLWRARVTATEFEF